MTTTEAPQTALEKAIACCKVRSMGRDVTVLFQIGPDRYEAHVRPTNKPKGVFVAEFAKGKIIRQAWNLADMARNA